eukprot:4429358-Pleurochrysis_carterae.AAC.1
MFDIGAASRAGQHTSMNQDNWLLLTSADAACAAVFDGHGFAGEKAASRAADALRAALCTTSPKAKVLNTQGQADSVAGHMTLDPAWQSEPVATIQQTMASLQEAVLQAHKGSDVIAQFASRGEGVDFGCTATVAVLQPSLRESALLVANCGDSPAFLCSADSDERLSIRRLTARHHASDAAERRWASL